MFLSGEGKQKSQTKTTEERTEKSEGDVSNSDDDATFQSLARESSSKTFVDKIVEINLKNVAVSIVSDYVTELALFYVFLKVSIHSHTKYRKTL
jgi:hypothetical protein